MGARPTRPSFSPRIPSACFTRVDLIRQVSKELDAPFAKIRIVLVVKHDGAGGVGFRRVQHLPVEVAARA